MARKQRKTPKLGKEDQFGIADFMARRESEAGGRKWWDTALDAAVTFFRVSAASIKRAWQRYRMHRRLYARLRASMPRRNELAKQRRIEAAQKQGSLTSDLPKAPSALDIEKTGELPKLPPKKV